MAQSLPQLQSNVDQSDSIDLRRHLAFFIDNRWLISAIALAAMILGATYALIATPIYQPTLLIQVEETPSSPDHILGELSKAFDLKTASAPEMEVLRSRMVIERAIDNSRFYIEVRPKYFPGIGAWIARNNKQVSEPGLFGYGGYVWGAEKAKVSLFNVPEDLEGDSFVLTAGQDGSYRLTQEEKGIEISGQVGKTVKARARNGDIELRVDQLSAKPGGQFLLTRSVRLEAVESLQKALNITEKNKPSGIISVALSGPDPRRTTNVLNEIGRQYIRQNEERKSEAAEKSLAFLNKQLPELKQELERSEAKYNEVRNARGTFDLDEEAKGILQRSVSAQIIVAQLKQKKAELLTRFTNEHPVVDAINQQLRTLNHELAGIDARIKKLPAVEQDVLRLSRDMKVNTEVYTAVLSTAQQLRLVSASKVGNVRLLDSPVVPVKPIKPEREKIILLAAIIGLVIGSIAAFVKKIFYGRVKDPQEIEQLLGFPVSAAIPHSENQELLSARIRSKERIVAVLPRYSPSDGAIESLRRFRTSLQFSMRDSTNNIIVITGPTPEVGKSFVSANFATVLASIGKKVLLVDGDLRTGHLHRYFGLERREGLSEAITGTSLEQLIHKDVVENVDFMSTGELPSNPAEMLAHANLRELLHRLAEHYDFILIDTAPVLAVSDALIVAPHAGATFNVVRSGVTTVSEIEEAITQFNQSGATVTGIVVNDLRSRSARYGYKYGYRLNHA